MNEMLVEIKLKEWKASFMGKPGNFGANEAT
jgi:hypothetical protein